MSLLPSRRQSMTMLEQRLQDQDDTQAFDWLNDIVSQFETEDKPISFNPSAVPLSPHSNISSGASSANSSPHAFPLFDFDSESDGDEGEDPVILQFSHSVDSPTKQTKLVTSENTQQDIDSFCPQETLDTPYVPRDLSFGLLHRPAIAQLPDNDYLRSSSPAICPPEPAIPFASRSCVKPVESDPESDDVVTEDEYLPSSESNPNKRRNSSRTNYGARAASSSAQRGDQRRRTSSPSGNTVPPFSSMETSAPTRRSNKNPWACPHCSWVQRNKRTPDLKRHIRTHTRLTKPAEYVCRGVPEGTPEALRVPRDAVRFLHQGIYWVGGCGKEFSRRDAMKRHLDNDNIQCFGHC